MVKSSCGLLCQVTAILYAMPTWAPSHGGQLRLWLPSDASDRQYNELVSLAASHSSHGYSDESTTPSRPEPADLHSNCISSSHKAQLPSSHESQLPSSHESQLPSSLSDGHHLSALSKASDSRCSPNATSYPFPDESDRNSNGAANFANRNASGTFSQNGSMQLCK